MIQISSLTPNDIGAWVVYTLTGEKGRITSWNDTHIFVVYRCSGNWHQYSQYTAEATHPNNLNRIEDELSELAGDLGVSKAFLLTVLRRLLAAFPEEGDPMPPS